MSPGLGWEGPEENKKATQDDQDTPQSKISFWAHSSAVRAHCEQYGKKFNGDPVPKWMLKTMYPYAPSTFSGDSPPPKKRRRSEDSEEVSPASSPCEKLSLRYFFFKVSFRSHNSLGRKAASRPKSGSLPLDDLPTDLPCPDSQDVTSDWLSLLVHNVKKLESE